MANMFYTITKPWGATLHYKVAQWQYKETEAINADCLAIFNRLSGSSFDAVAKQSYGTFGSTQSCSPLASTNSSIAAASATQDDSNQCSGENIIRIMSCETPGTLEYARIHEEDDPAMHHHVNVNAQAGIPSASSCGRSAENVDHGNSETKCAERQKSLDHQQGLSLDDDFDEVPLGDNDYPGWYFNYLEGLTTAKSCLAGPE
jgi:hypothetical protein